MRDDEDVQLVLGIACLSNTCDEVSDDFLFVSGGNDDAVFSLFLRFGIFFLAKNTYDRKEYKMRE